MFCFLIYYEKMLNVGAKYPIILLLSYTCSYHVVGQIFIISLTKLNIISLSFFEGICLQFCFTHRPHIYNIKVIARFWISRYINCVNNQHCTVFYIFLKSGIASCFLCIFCTNRNSFMNLDKNDDAWRITR